MDVYFGLAVLLFAVGLLYGFLKQQQKHKFMGAIVISKVGEKYIMTLELDEDPEKLLHAKKVYFDVRGVEEVAT